MDSVNSYLRTIAERNLVKHAAGSAIVCPYCGEVMDCSRTVLVFGPHPNTWLGCAKCWGQGARCVREGKWEVLDGRVLFAPRRATKWAKPAADPFEPRRRRHACGRRSRRKSA